MIIEGLRLLRTYEAVHQFLTEVSRYLRLATHVDMEDDISEYAAAFLDGFAYIWFENLNKGRQQNGRSVAEYIVERERLESTLGKAVTKGMKESSFKEGLDKGIRDVLLVFSDLPFEQYKRKAEVVDEETRAEQKRAESLLSLSTSDSHSILEIDDGYGSGSQYEDGLSSDGDDDGEELDNSEAERSEESAGSDDGNRSSASGEEPDEELDEEGGATSSDESSEVSGGDAESDADAHVAAAVMNAVHRGWRRRY